MRLTDDESFCVSLTMNQESAIYFGENLFEHTFSVLLVFVFLCFQKSYCLWRGRYCGN